MQYTIQNPVLAEVLGLLSKRLDIRITFFDVADSETADQFSRPRSGFCAVRRKRDAEFDRRCVECDREHLHEAKGSRRAVIYRCHAGLLEGVVPLYNRRGLYLGSLVFGQIAPPEMKRCGAGVRHGDETELTEIARLLKIVGEYIIQQEMILLRRPPWVGKVEEYLAAHWKEKITLANLSRIAGVSPSQLAHGFAGEFGQPLRPYLCKLRLERAKTMLENGAGSKEAAAATGFYDEFHLSKAFKREYGAPPSAIGTKANRKPAAPPAS